MGLTEPPRLIFNTDGHWIINYQDRWEPEDITKMMPTLVNAGVDALSVLVGIDDDLSWRGVPMVNCGETTLRTGTPIPCPPTFTAIRCEMLNLCTFTADL